jgi:hypothetical protein
MHAGLVVGSRRNQSQGLFWSALACGWIRSHFCESIGQQKMGWCLVWSSTGSLGHNIVEGFIVLGLSVDSSDHSCLMVDGKNSRSL